MCGSDSSSNERASRTDIGKWVPVVLVLSVISFLFCTYTEYHLRRLVESGDPAMVQRGYIEAGFFLPVVVLLLISYFRSIFTKPGSVPNTPEWSYDSVSDPEMLNLQEAKRTGERRHCKWCGTFKPDRCHHCRVCNTCVLKMDHHCPWIYNCVGFRNYKFFYLLVFYSVCSTQCITLTMPETVIYHWQQPENSSQFWLVVVANFIAGCLSLAWTAFLLFHTWLAIKAMSTIEFCEKQVRKTGESHSIYHQGFVRNMKAILGPYPILWLMPICRPKGDGLTFVEETSRLAVDLEAATRRRSQRRSLIKQYAATGHQETCLKDTEALKASGC